VALPPIALAVNAMTDRGWPAALQLRILPAQDDPEGQLTGAAMPLPATALGLTGSFTFQQL